MTKRIKNLQPWMHYEASVDAKDVYVNSSVELDSRFKIKDFRLGKKGEYYLCPVDETVVLLQSDTASPFLILDHMENPEEKRNRDLKEILHRFCAQYSCYVQATVTPKNCRQGSASQIVTSYEGDN